MSLLEQLQSIDLSGITSARGSIRASIDAPALAALRDGGAAQAALGGLGGALSGVRRDFADPSNLLRPVVDAVAQEIGRLAPRDLPLERYAEAIGEAARMLESLGRGVGTDPLAIARLFGFALDEALDSAGIGGGYAVSPGDGLAQARALFDRVDGRLPADPAAIATLALDALLPVRRDALVAVRGGIDTLVAQSASIRLPATRTQGLVVAFDAVASAAAGTDAAALDRALRDLSRAGTHTVEMVGRDLAGAARAFEALHVERLLAPVGEAQAALRGAELGTLEFMQRLRALIAEAKGQIERIDAAALRTALDGLAAQLEAQARARFDAPLQEQVRRFTEWLRGLFAHLGLVEYRAVVTRFFHDAAAAIAGAGIDGPAREVHEALARVRGIVGGDLQAEVQNALAPLKAVVDGVLGNVVGALETIGNEVNAVAGQAQGILQQVADALASFKALIDGIGEEIDRLGIEQAAQQIVDTLRGLRETASELLSNAPLPEPARPLVEQLIEALDGIDLDAAFDPLREAASQFEIPDEVAATIRDGLAAAKDALDNLVPAGLIASIEEEVGEVLDQMRGFDPGALVPGVRGVIEEAAGFLEGLDVQGAIAPVRAPFTQALALFDEADPHRLLAPVVRAWDDVLGGITIPSPADAVRGLGSALNAATERAAGALTGPLEQLAGGGGGATGSGGAGAGAGTGTGTGAGTGTGSGGSGGGAGGSAADASLPDTNVRPGDIVRFLGFIPARLREALAALEAGPAGDALAQVDALTAGLARDLRAAERVLLEQERRLEAELEALFAPVAAAQARAQLALQARAGGGGVDVQVSLTTVASFGPGALRGSLAGAWGETATSIRASARQAGAHGAAALDRLATALERASLTQLVGSVDRLLGALDVEPIAAELDELAAIALRRAPALLNEAAADLSAFVERIKALTRALNPAALAERFLPALDVVREQIAVLDPRRLADELGEIHAAIRAALAAYDPGTFAAEIEAVAREAARTLRALDPTALLGDIADLDGIADRIEAALPTRALAGVGTSLQEVGQRLIEIDPQGLFDAVERLPPRIVEALEIAARGIVDEIRALLESLRYAGASGSASVSVEAHT